MRITLILLVTVVILASMAVAAHMLWFATNGEFVAIEREASLTCADGTELTVQYLTDESVVVTREGTPYELSHATSASGARYTNSDESFVFWNKGDTSMVLADGEVVHSGCRAPGTPTSESYETDGIANGYAISFVHPVAAEVSVENDTYYKVLFAGPGNEPPALTDGWMVTMTLLTKDADTSLETFVDEALADIPNTDDVVPEQMPFYSRESYRFSHATELGNTVTEHFVRVDDVTVARITVSAVGAQAQQYRTDIDRLLESIAFPYVGNGADLSDIIRLDTPEPNTVIESPVTIAGEARGPWYFEANFSAALTDWDGKIIAEGVVTADGEWMTEEFVSFEAELEFESPYTAGDPDFMKRGTLILQKANPSGLPENDAAFEIPVRFAE